MCNVPAVEGIGGGEPRRTWGEVQGGGRGKGRKRDPKAVKAERKWEKMGNYKNRTRSDQIADLNKNRSCCLFPCS